jgi:hypothetical protein
MPAPPDWEYLTKFANSDEDLLERTGKSLLATRHQGGGARFSPAPQLLPPIPAESRGDAQRMGLALSLHSPAFLQGANEILC